MYTEIGAGVVGVLAGVSGSGLMFRFLNAKIDKKQDRNMCETIAKNFAESLHKGDEKFDKIIGTQTDMLISFEGLTKELKHLNGKTP